MPSLKIIILYFVTTIHLTCIAQMEDRIWYFGGDYQNSTLPGVGLDFNSGPPVILTNSQMGFTEGSAVQCSSNGSLLFYTNGEKIWDKTHSIMPNGTNLGGGISSEQSSLIIPYPNDTSKFYLFSNAGFPTAGGSGLFYSEIDLSLNNGNGDITNIKKVPMLTETAEWLTGTWHSNGMDYWVITADYDSCIFYSYHISSSGIGLPVKTNLGFNKIAQLSTIEFNNKGNKFTFSVAESNIAQRMIADFNQSTGVVSNPIYIDSITNQAACFSPDDNLFYYYGFGQNNEILFQCDMNAPNISASKQILKVIPTSMHIGMKKGPDGKIYCNNIYSDSLGCINNPNQIGSGCNYVGNAIYFNGKKTGALFPNKTFGKHIKPLSVVKKQIDCNITIGPNPFYENFTIETNRLLTHYSIFNAFGIKIIENNFTDFNAKKNLTITGPIGVYFLFVHDNLGDCYKHTLIKQ